MFLKRLMSAVLLLSAVALLLFVLPAVVSMVVLSGIAALGLLEFYGILNKAGIPAFRWLGVGAGILLLAGTFLGLNASQLLPASLAPLTAEAPDLFLTVIVFAVCIRQFPQKNNPQPLPTIACTMMGIMYVPFLLAFFQMLAFRWDPVSWTTPFSPTARMLIIYLILVVKASDIGAYLVGSMVGRHKLFPRVSPGKTWEGLAGGLATGVLMSVLFGAWTRLGAPSADTTTAGHLVIGSIDAWVLGFLLSAIGVLGDLVESLLKRSAGMKDSGGMVPGMGGILDVLDSLLFAAPVLYFYLRWATGAV